MRRAGRKRRAVRAMDLTYPKYWPEIEETTLEDLNIMPDLHRPVWAPQASIHVEFASESFALAGIKQKGDFIAGRLPESMGVDELLLDTEERFRQRKVPAIPHAVPPRIKEIRRRLRVKRAEEQRVFEETRLREEAAHRAKMEALAQQIAEEERKAEEALRRIAEKKAQRIALQREKARRLAHAFSPKPSRHDACFAADGAHVSMGEW